MSVIEATNPVAELASSLPRPHDTEPDAALVHLCARLREDQAVARGRDTVEPQAWEHYSRDTAALHALVCGISDTPAAGPGGLRAKAFALYALLDDSGGDLYGDAAVSDRLAWSLIRDILAGYTFTAFPGQR